MEAVVAGHHIVANILMSLKIARRLVVHVKQKKVIFYYRNKLFQNN